MAELKYEEFHPQSRQDLVKALASNDPEQVRNALYSAAKHEADWAWSQEQCLKFLAHKESEVRWAAALSLGYIAVYQRKLDLTKVLPALHAAKKDGLIAPVVEDSLEMIQQYVKPN
jgi:HEAT repeat protein